MKKIAAALVILGATLSAPAFAQSPSGPPQSVATEAKPGAEDVVIAPGAKRATSPDGDPRSIGERREHEAAYDRCLVTAKEPEMYDPVGSTPEEFCSRRLGMDSATSIPNSVKSPRGN